MTRTSEDFIMALPTQYDNLPGIFGAQEERGLGIVPPTRGPRTLVLGTAENGQSGWPYTVTSSAIAASAFGSSGSLTRGMYEVRTAGAANVDLYRIGATSAKLEHVGDSAGVAGYAIETIRQDDDAGSIYTLYYDDSEDRLVVWNAQTGLVVYDNDSTDPVDYGEVIVSGSRAAGGGPDIAGPSVGMALEDVVSEGHAGTAYTAGTDGTSPSRMKLFEYLYQAYKELLGQDFDYIVPMDVYLDDKNVADGYAFSGTYLSSIVDGATYPDMASDDDILGRLFVEEYAGRYYYFWDLDNNGDAELFPYGVGAASATTKIDGTALSSVDFHEVNFGYQLARFCFENTTNNRFVIGAIGVRPPASVSLADLSTWVGKSPVYTTSSTGDQTISRFQDNGTGLLGNKFMGGSWSFRGGAAYGGLILTDSEWLDGTELSDDNGYPVDVGAYISVVAAWVRLFNAWDTRGRGYVATAAPTYMGYVSSLDEKDAPTNKVIRNIRRVFNLGPRQVDRLAGKGYVFIYERPKGLTISDAPTAARPTSDYRRLTTIRIVKRCSGAVRDGGDPFIGRSFKQEDKAALELAISTRLDKLIKGGYIVRYQIDLRQTMTQRVNGEADIYLTIVPAWELRRITVKIALAPV